MKEHALVREQQQRRNAEDTGIVFDARDKYCYQLRVRGGVAPLTLYGGENQQKSLVSTAQKYLGRGDVLLPEDVKDDGRAELAPYFKPSWVQTLDEIPYEDIVSAQAVNAFVPLILCRELLPLMGGGKSTTTTMTVSDTLPPPPPPPPPPSEPKQPRRESKPKTGGAARKPLGYIINVSSREGLFEARPWHSAKRATHVHTNMTKAAVNMITQTEPAAAWQARRVAMNTVDPGYMSPAPEMDGAYGGEGRPLGWEDGAGRVL
ncbi:hypothetical protein B0T26DRAFT_751005 [Lasiosphaeria miniovina]|uniref:Uncharacterized protein n=1 Tax=Lasiosphaeria miniovina TaxID=1954250 RepID=A0AA40AJ72_9PEZI|nr:uncharacterized protein B0T26DRAFT_751005 [Lasiosphaeria miniovina]KAK0716858.1 hypothetical protein B0T26DRAFT_751005 [Lasiosphaeria miniovina]